MNIKLAEVAGYVGMVLIHGAIVPTTVANIMGWSDAVPPVYIISNAFGFFTQSVLLAIIVFGA